MNKTLRNAIELEAVGLEIDETISDLECPFCHGGPSGAKKFGITRIDTGLLYNCFRASCPDGRGFIPTSGRLLAGPKPVSAKKWKGPYRGEFRPLEDSDREYFARRFDLTDPYMDFIGVSESNQYVLEVKTFDGYVRGYVVRRGCWTGDPVCPRSAAVTGPKSRAYTNTEGGLLLSWHKPRTCPHGHSRGYCGNPACIPYNAGLDRAVIVEDQISASKVAQAGLVGVALTGSYLGEDKVIEIAKSSPTEVVIALDADATGEAFKAARKWGLAFPSVRVLTLQNDIKDMKREEVEELLR